MSPRLALLLLLAACEPGGRRSIVPPLPSAHDYPCGTQGKVCAGGKCCGADDACGGEPGCPAGLCCYAGELGAARDAGADARAQWPAR